ncbi:discoidin domain-containing protein [Luteimonas sp. M1R5S59]|uniref:Discoidin domain-containing protein n=2 Tax=Luteimonas kalidii TaxID=3042025 RepID=A0ABT6JT23_9GAMM|nr:discoidin domain-containing protein [Luteimonas kalidii]MDH5833840.1 discoidin domain-containing protein [Luteimonas kalidii]
MTTRCPAPHSPGTLHVAAAMFLSLAVCAGSFAAEPDTQQVAAHDVVSFTPEPPRLLDGFEDPSPWRVVTSDQVSGSLRTVEGAQGRALCLDYDFNGVSGYAGIQRDLPLDYPGNFRFSFQLRGDSPDNDLQFKLVDASGDNVWWVNRPKYDYPRAWTPVHYKRRHIDKAWGPDPDPVLRSSAKLEFTIYNQVGGRGSVCFDSLSLEVLPADDDGPLTAIAMATAGDAALAVDGRMGTSWRAERAPLPQRLVLDLGRLREFGGLRLRWDGEDHASRYRISLSGDGTGWREARRVRGGNGGDDWIALPESEARYIALDVEDGPTARYGLAEAVVQPLAFGATPNDFVGAIAAQSPRGRFPRGFHGEQPYWTILGLDGGQQQGLIGEDGAIEVARGGFSLEPFVLVDDALATWADVTTAQSLQDGYLPIPSVRWTRDDLALDITAFAHGEPRDSRLVARYRLSNPGGTARDYTLALAVRPFQVNPPSQFLNTRGGVSPIGALSIDGGTVSVDGRARVFAKQLPSAAFATPFDGGMAVAHLAAGSRPTTTAVVDPVELASGALLYRMRLAPYESRTIEVMMPITGTAALARRWWDADALQAETAAMWRGKLDRVTLTVPPQGQALADTLRTSLAHMLISRIGPRLQPGTRSYARSWIRDGAMISEGLLRMGRPDVVREYVEWYAPFQFDNGKVPCCVDDRGSDPVPENDSHGELIFSIAEYWRHTGDLAFLERMWPHVEGAYRYMEQLRLSERTPANRRVNRAFYGMMPASISHEGYSAKPMHSYWDNFWTLRGYKDAVQVAQALGKVDAQRGMTASRDQFHADLMDSLRAAADLHEIDFLPGAAELGDFDPTSTTIALAPGGEQERLPQDLLHNTFERYWTRFLDRRDGRLEWKDYTPYEWRNVAAFVRLGWRERAQEAVDFFFADRAPQAWNQWGEVVSRTPRQPFFLGDLPHAWVGSDFVRSALDMFAYPRERDGSLVLAAGIPADWLDGPGVGIDGLRTASGALAYTLRRDGAALVLEIDDTGLQLPEGGLVLPWPLAGEPGATNVEAGTAAWDGRELRVTALPARVRVAVPEAARDD